MDSLFKRIRQRLSGQISARQNSRVTVAAFGKHPAWDDHMDDIGLETPALVALKRVLYVEGIGRNIDKGNWAELESRQSAIEFGHTFVWCRDDQVIAGRLWPSRDGRGRTSYPMVACVHCWRVPLRWVYDRVLPRLVHLETECQDSTTASDVRVRLSACRDALAAMLDPSAGPEQSSHAEAAPLARLADTMGPGPDTEGLIRILYHIDREMSAISASRTERDRCEHSVHARVPVSSGRPPEAALLWTRLLLDEYGPRTGVLVIMPQQRAWLDIILGEPSPAQLYCLRASLEALPLTSTVPYKVSEDFARRVRQKAGVFRAPDYR